jgi:hypothetical protein
VVWPRLTIRSMLILGFNISKKWFPVVNLLVNRV